MSKGQLWLGTQGWNYAGWRGPFYSSTTRPADFLKIYARAFSTVEVDSTFYAIPPSSTVKGWISRTPENFRFTLKLPREITHERRFVDSAEILSQFVERVRLLEIRLGAVLIQCGPDFSPSEVGALEKFLENLPTDIRFAVEFRQKSWISEPTFNLLRSYGAALALSDGRWIPRDTLLALCSTPTAEFSYIRWMGPDRTLTDYSRIQVDRSLETDDWVSALLTLQSKVEDVFLLANNHFAGHAPASVRMLQQKLGLPVIDPSDINEQRSLF